MKWQTFLLLFSFILKISYIVLPLSFTLKYFLISGVISCSLTHDFFLDPLTFKYLGFLNIISIQFNSVVRKRILLYFHLLRLILWHSLWTILFNIHVHLKLLGLVLWIVIWSRSLIVLFKSMPLLIFVKFYQVLREVY